MKFFNFLKKTILVVEDDSSLNFALAEKLEREGFIVYRIQNGIEVVGAVALYNPDLILLDLMLPGKDGMSVLEILRGQDMHYKKPVVIFSNLRADGDMMKRAESFHAEFIEKTQTKLSDIVEKIRSLL